MERNLIESIYTFKLTDREMGKIRATERTLPIIKKANGVSGVRGITIGDNKITVKIEPRPEDVGEKIIGKVETIIKDELIWNSFGGFW